MFLIVFFRFVYSKYNWYFNQRTVQIHFYDKSKSFLFNDRIKKVKGKDVKAFNFFFSKFEYFCKWSFI